MRNICRMVISILPCVRMKSILFTRDKEPLTNVRGFRIFGGRQAVAAERGGISPMPATVPRKMTCCDASS